MKTICLGLMRVVAVALLAGGLHAIPTAADQTASESASTAGSAQNTRPSGNGDSRNDAGANRQERPGGAAKNRPRSKELAARPHHPQPFARQQALPSAGNPTNVRPSAPAQSAAVGNRGSLQNEAIYRALPVRSGSAIRPGTAAGSLRHRDPNPPVIGGAASSNDRNTAAIDGTRTNLKGATK